ncbi:Aspartyl/Asparaginyl beta-hydroxylase-domain-containing protein [Tribonema minus]|uniref:Aspartyl/Asparaginyl beta-hydroxylase-domain-containing protein n=1 Tax=Tribonema minus TaxID=303371 RepID=A0A835YR86_9STRA|nr:Aspartyl/Asparaginyl beta-hydroxylase-domain-containing protein [Tribonema minus]
MLSCRNPPLGLNRYEYFPEANGFEAPATFAAIRAEVNTYLDSRTVPCLHETVPDIRISSAVGEGGQCWRFLPLKKLGKLDEKHRTHFPALFDLLEQDCIANAIISSLDPGTVIPAHRGYFKGFIRYHLAIEAPTDAPASITCGGIRYEWKTGEGILFDDTFIHSVINPSRSRRTVLYLDIKRRNLPPYVQRMTDAVYAAVAGNKLLQAALADQHKTQSIDE